MCCRLKTDVKIERYADRRAKFVIVQRRRKKLKAFYEYAPDGSVHTYTFTGSRELMPDMKEILAIVDARLSMTQQEAAQIVTFDFNPQPIYTPTIIRNGGFESGLLHWTDNWYDYVTASTTEAHSGLRSAKFTKGAHGAGRIVNTLLRPIPVKYLNELSFWLFIKTAADLLTFRALYTDGSETQTTRTCAAINTWQQHFITTLDLTKVIEAIKLTFTTSGAGQPCYVDDVELTL